jgi:TonB family protein
MLQGASAPVRRSESSTLVDQSNKQTDHTVSRPHTSSTTTWILASKPLAVALSADLLFRIRAAVIPSLEAQPQLCPGGLLLGSCDHSQAWNVEIMDHVPLEWDLSRGGAPFLTEAQSCALQDKLVSYSGDRLVVGFYRCSRTVDREGSHHPGDPLMGTRRPVAEADRSLLSLCSRLGSVSIGLRLDMPGLYPRGIVLWEDANVYELVPGGAKTPVTTIQAAPQKLGHFDEKSPDPKPQLVPERSNGASALPPQTIGQREHWISLGPIAWLLGTILISVLTYVGAHFLLKPFVVKLAGQIHAAEGSGGLATVSSRDTLGLKANQNGSTLELSWDSTSSFIKSAKSGKLVIVDGALTRELNLTNDQLHGDKIFYTPLGGDVTIQLEVMDSKSHAVAESIRVLRGTPMPSVLDTSGQSLDRQSSSVGNFPVNRSTSPQPAQPAVSPGNTTFRGSKTWPQARTETSIVMVPGAPTQLQSLTPGTVGNPPTPPLAENQQPARDQGSPSATLSAPLLSSPFRPGPPLMLLLPQQNIDDSNAKRETHKSIDAPTASRPTLAINVNKLMTPPQVLVGPTPDISHSMHPPLYKDLFIHIAVKINEQGNVTSATLAPVASGVPSYFANQALTAARRWRFSPAKLNGRPVQSEMVIKFHFEPMNSSR